jgi:hypothetical protein
VAKAIACWRVSRKGEADGQVDIFTREPPGYSQFVFCGTSGIVPLHLGREYLRNMAGFSRARRGASAHPSII